MGAPGESAAAGRDIRAVAKRKPERNAYRMVTLSTPVVGWVRLADILTRAPFWPAAPWPPHNPARWAALLHHRLPRHIAMAAVRQRHLVPASVSAACRCNHRNRLPSL